MHLPSRQEDCVPHLKQEVIQRGIVHRLHLLKRVRMGKDRFYIYRRHFVPIPEKHWIRRHIFFALCKQSTNNPSVFCVYLETQRPKRLHHLLELSRNISWQTEKNILRERILYLQDVHYSEQILRRDRNWMTIILVRSVRELQHI